MKTRSILTLVVLISSLFTWGCQAVPKEAYDNLENDHQKLMKKHSALQKKYYNAKSQNQKLRQRLKEQGESLDEFEDLASNVETDKTGAVKLKVPPKLKDDVKKVKVDGQTALRMSARIVFEPGSDTLSENGKQTLKNVMPVLKQFGKNVRFIVEGHTDNQPIKQSKDRFPSNWHLSAARAISVARSLISQGIDEDIIKVVGRAYTEPIASNETEEGRKKNRRVEIIVIPRA